MQAKNLCRHAKRAYRHCSACARAPPAQLSALGPFPDRVAIQERIIAQVRENLPGRTHSFAFQCDPPLFAGGRAAVSPGISSRLSRPTCAPPKSHSSIAALHQRHNIHMTFLAGHKHGSLRINSKKTSAAPYPSSHAASRSFGPHDSEGIFNHLLDKYGGIGPRKSAAP